MDAMGSSNAHFENISNMVERQVVAIKKRNEILNSQVEIMHLTPSFQYIEGYICKMLSTMNI